ncbi:MAG: hypothetical protein MJ191_01985 [Clostridium sp.]|nr:hypothetical protein [Clostridium sp.]
MKKLSQIFNDIFKCIAIGITLTVSLSIVIAIICLFSYKGNIINIVSVIKTVLIFIGAFGMILVAILIMKKKKEKPMQYINEWKKRYKILSYKYVMLFVTLTILTCGGIIDWVLYYKL